MRAIYFALPEQLIVFSIGIACIGIVVSLYFWRPVLRIPEAFWELLFKLATPPVKWTARIAAVAVGGGLLYLLFAGISSFFQNRTVLAVIGASLVAMVVLLCIENSRLIQITRSRH